MPSNSARALDDVEEHHVRSVEAHVSRSPKSSPANRPPGRIAVRIRSTGRGKTCGRQNGRLKLAKTRSAAGTPRPPSGRRRCAAGWHARPGPARRSRRIASSVRIDRDDLPAAPQQLGGLESLPAPEIDGQPAALLGVEHREDLQQEVARLSLALLRRSSRPSRRAGHPSSGRRGRRRRRSPHASPPTAGTTGV